MSDIVHEGLEGIIASETRLSLVDGERGRLVVAGREIESLTGQLSFEQTYALLFAAVGAEAVDLEAQLARGRARAFEALSGLGDALDRKDGMDALRASVAHMPGDASSAEVVAAVAVYTAAWSRRQRGLPAISPRPEQGHAESLLAMLGEDVSFARVQALDAYLVTVLEHGFNASAFAARVVASTRSDRVSAVVAGIGALKGPLHGGAPGPVLEMLDAIGVPERAESYLRAELDAGRRIMGMGHRIYRQRDPRAFVLERALERLERATQDDVRIRSRLALARAVEHAAEGLLSARHPDRPLRANVEFYTAVLLEAVGVSGALFSPLFACARSAGWAAHFEEQRKYGRLIRPTARYIGVLPA
ncbi:MAG TPA: citrate synthase [Polyangiales bacterium]|nr:citrate synthase [Polyangiales bacterium]